MIKIELNGKIIAVKKTTQVKDIDNLSDKYNQENSIIYHNGYSANLADTLEENDKLMIIKKNMQPSADELESLISARHTPFVYEKLKQSKVAIIGLGGLGSNVAISLARMGVGKLKLIDFDHVEPSNINRQQYFLDQLWMYKTDAIEETLKRINPFVKLEKVPVKITEENIAQILEDYEVIIEAVDGAVTKSMIISSVLKLLKTSYIIGASGIAGLYDTTSFTYKTISDRAIVVGDFEHEAKKGSGLMATRVAVAANIQANLAVKYILGESLND